MLISSALGHDFGETDERQAERGAKMRPGQGLREGLHLSRRHRQNRKKDGYDQPAIRGFEPHERGEKAEEPFGGWRGPGARHTIFPQAILVRPVASKRAHP